MPAHSSPQHSTQLLMHLRRCVREARPAEARRRFVLLPCAEQGALMRELAARTQRDPEGWLDLLEALLASSSASLDDDTLRALILGIKHHRPASALNLLTHVRSTRDRISLGNCLAALWSRIDITAAWNAISSSALPAGERLALHSVMI